MQESLTCVDNRQQGHEGVTTKEVAGVNGATPGERVETAESEIERAVDDIIF